MSAVKSQPLTDNRANATRIQSAEETFLFYKNGRWFWINSLVVLILTVLYVTLEPIGGNNGGTWYGYGSGGLAAAGIAYLMWYGVRKRSYHASTTSLQGCLSAHAWLGVALAIIVPLHSGFQFGLNVHTLAYILMVFVVTSGVYGAVNYVKLAPLIAAHRGGGHTPQLLQQIERLSGEISRLTADRSDALIALQNRFDFAVVPCAVTCLRGKLIPAITQTEISDLLAAVPPNENDDALNLVSLIGRKRELATRLQEDVRILTKLRIWLWIHVPVSLALVLAVIIHIVVVFLYR